MGQVGVKIFEISGYTGYFILVWKKAATPLVEEGRSDALPFPVASQTILAPNLSPESYIFEFWQSSDGTALDTKIGADWPIDASAYSGSIATRYEYVVDRGQTNVTESTGSEVWADPVTGDTQIVDERYAGVAKEDIQVEMRGIGQRRKDEWDVRAAGGITLTALTDSGPESFSNQDSIFVTVFQKTSTTPTPTVVNDYSDVKIITGDATVDDTFKNKVVFCNSTIPVTTLIFPAFNTMADQKMKFVTNGMTGNYLTLVFTTAVYFSGANRTQIHLAIGRLFEILIKNGVAYVPSEISQSGYDVRGVRKHQDDVKPGQLKLDRTVRAIDEYPGITEWIQTLPAGSIITDSATKNTDDNKHKYYINTALNEFALPDDQDMHYRSLKTFDGANGYPGAYTADAIPDHRHSQTIGTIPTTIWNRLSTLLLGTSAQIGRYNGIMSNNQGGTDLTSSPVKTDGSAYSTVSDETRVKAVRQNAVINL